MYGIDLKVKQSSTATIKCKTDATQLGNLKAIMYLIKLICQFLHTQVCTLHIGRIFFYLNAYISPVLYLGSRKSRYVRIFSLILKRIDGKCRIPWTFEF